MTLLTTGAVLAGKYALGEVLGSGGFGVVYKATTMSTGRPVAVKILKSTAPEQQATHAARFMREMKTVAQLQCPHTMTLYDFGRAEDVLFMVCEYIEGEDLLDLLARRGRLWEHEVVHIVQQALLALAEAHDLGVLHRDIKPANLRLTEYRGDPLCVKVLDFGLAKSWLPADDEAALTAEGRVVGTPRYMSPEHRAGLPLTPASDIYSLGLVAIEMLLGRDMTKLEHRQNLRITDEMPVTRPLAVVVNRMLSTQTSERYTRASQVLADLQSMRTPTEQAPLATSETDEDTIPTSLPAESPPTIHEQIEGSVETDSLGAPRANALFVAAAVGALALVCVALLFFSDEEKPPPVTPQVAPRAIPLVEVEPREAAVDVGRTPDAAHVATTDDCGGLAPLEPGIHVLREMSGISPNSVAVGIPRDYDPTIQHGVVLAFADIMRDGEYVLEAIRPQELSTKDYPYVYVGLGPQHGVVGRWTPEETRRTLERTLPLVVANVCVDLERMFALGRGNGGLAADHLPSFASVHAVGLSGYRLTLTAPFSPSPAPTLAIEGRDDPISPLEGGTNCMMTPVPAYADHQAGLLKSHGCRGKSKKRNRPADAACQTWSCEVPLTMCIADGGREWAGQGSEGTWPPCWIAPSGFDFRTAFLDFFKSHDPAFADPTPDSSNRD